MDRLYWEDLDPGDVFETEPRTITREEIIEFASEYDPQPFHLDEESAKASPLGGIAASGWHVCCIVMRMITDGYVSRTAFLGAPGVEEVRWVAPLHAGTTVTVRATVLEKRASRSRPEMGFVRFTHVLLDSAGKTIATMTVSPMFERRERP